ncbi:HD domain-containing protein [Planctomicrobium sp. SH668]|uniref:HD domain-containing protein n=1 Tax=Planctomicrobium sp. SH668 TaxID=3448126 RepID=UPI003F5B9711
MSEYDSIPELADLQSGRSLIRVPPELNIPFTPRVRALVDTEEFQRLSHISQLGLVSKVYPGAQHTRFEHALGVYHNALRYIQQLIKDPRFRELIDRRSAELLIVASLLHDLGHWPFCHPIEDMELDGLPAHEAYASRYLAEGTELAAVLKRDWQLEPLDVLDVLVARTSSPRMKLLRSILSGPIDVDKMDYLDRDSLHCGVPYGRNFDRQRLIQSLVVNETGDGLAITVKGKTAAELMVFARYVMFSEVYWHHAVRSATSMFARGFYELHDRLDLNKLFSFTDAEMIAKLRAAAVDTEYHDMLEGVFGLKRQLYKQMAEYSLDQSRDIYQRIAGQPYRKVVQISNRLVDSLNRDYGMALKKSDLLIDSPPPHREVELAIDVYFPKKQTYRPLRKVSPVVEALATTQFDDWVKRVRVFLAPAHVEQAARIDWENAIMNATSDSGDAFTPAESL